MRFCGRRASQAVGGVSAEVIGEEVVVEDSEEESCAWCLEERGILPLDGSHGICARHAEEQYQLCRQVRQVRHTRG